MAFAQVPADVVLLETGLGGRYDATNVLAKPAVTALTSISMDHMQYLGTTLAAIAGEKAAIMKPGVPCVSVAQQPEALAVIETAAVHIGAVLQLQDRDWSVSDRGDGLAFDGPRAHWKLPLPGLPGRHQYDNAGLALAALEQSGLPIPAFAARSGLRSVEWPARAQRLNRGPMIHALPSAWELWLDGGHNAGAGFVVADFAAEQWGDSPLHLICGMLTTKAADDYLRPLASVARSFTAVPIVSSDAGFAPDDLATTARGVGMSDVHVAASSDHALAGIISRDQSRRVRVLICGSLYLAGDVLKHHG
jgi:dihydrofolate synthase/folylpolyglutamate synthase